MKKFNYESDYKKFKNGDDVKITFKEEKTTIIKNVKIISIDSKKISFEDKENVYECTPTEIISIKNTLLNKVLHIFVLIEFFFILVGVLFSSFPTHEIYISGATITISYHTGAILIWALIFIGTFIIPLKSKNTKIILWGFYPLIFLPLAIFFNFDTFGVNTIIGNSADFSIFDFVYLDEVLKYLKYPFIIIALEFICIYPKSSLIKKRLLDLFVCLILLYICILAVRIGNYEEYEKTCEEKGGYTGERVYYDGEYNILTGCSLNLRIERPCYECEH